METHTIDLKLLPLFLLSLGLDFVGHSNNAIYSNDVCQSPAGSLPGLPRTASLSHVMVLPPPCSAVAIAIFGAIVWI